MTYSRPTTGTVSALFLPTRPQDAQGADRAAVSVSPSGRFLDFSNPAQEGKNAGENLAALGSFMQEAFKVGAPIYKEYLQGEGKRQAGEFLRNTNVSQLYQSANEDQRNLIATLNPYGQNLVVNAGASVAANRYVQVVQTEGAASTILRGNASREDKVKENARIKARAREYSGIDRVPAAALVPLMGEITVKAAQVFEDAYADQIKVERQQQKEVFSRQVNDSLGTLSNAAGAVADAVVAPDQGGGQAALQDFAAKKGLWVKGLSDAFNNNLYQTMLPGEYATVVWTGIAGRLQEVEMSLGPGEAQRLVSTLLSISQADVSLGTGESKANLWAIAIGDGSGNIRDRLNSYNLQLQPRVEAEQKEAQLNQLGGVLAVLRNPDASPEERAAAQAQQETLMRSMPVELQSQALTLSAQAESYGQRTTPEQQRELGVVQTQLINNPNMSASDRARLINSNPNLSQGQKNQLLANVTEAKDPVLGLTATASQYTQPDLMAATSSIVRKNVEKGWLTSKEDVEAFTKRTMEDLQVQATRQTEKRLKELVATGQTVTPIQAAEIYRNEIQAITKTRVKEAGEAPPQILSQSQRIGSEVNYVQQQLNRTKGVGTIGLFPESVIRGARAAGVPIDFPNVRRYFLNRIGTLKGEDGKSKFPDPSKAWQQMVEEGRAGRRPQARPQQPQQQSAGPNPAAVIGAGMMVPLVGVGGLPGAARLLQQALNPEPAPKPPAGGTGGRGGATSSRPMPNGNTPAEVARRVLTGGLNALGQVIAPAANAGEMPRPQAPRPAPRTAALPVGVINEGGLDTLARLWRESGRGVGAGTGPLPQLGGGAQVKQIPLAIANPLHPIFVAIGIAEGTRTASGGYTQAYRGHADPNPANGWNIGTVSGKGSSPAAVDQQWMANLTRRSLEVAPVLQRLGVQPGTQAWNRILFNILDLSVQSGMNSGAIPDFIKKLPQVIQQGATIEAIAKARADSYFIPGTGRLDAPGFQNNYSRLLSDQRSRAGAFDYKRRF